MGFFQAFFKFFCAVAFRVDSAFRYCCSLLISQILVLLRKSDLFLLFSFKIHVFVLIFFAFFRVPVSVLCYFTRSFFFVLCFSLSIFSCSVLVVVWTFSRFLRVPVSRKVK